MNKRIRGGYKVTIDNSGNETFKAHPAIGRMRRVSRERYERLLALLRYFKQGLSVQEIAEKTGWYKNKIYHEMYALKNMGLLDPDFKNPKVSVHGNIAEMLRKEVDKVGKTN